MTQSHDTSLFRYSKNSHKKRSNNTKTSQKVRYIKIWPSLNRFGSTIYGSNLPTPSNTCTRFKRWWLYCQSFFFLIYFSCSLSVTRGLNGNNHAHENFHLEWNKRWLMISPTNTNLVEDVDNFLPVKFRWIPFSGCRDNVKIVSANYRSERLSLISD